MSSYYIMMHNIDNVLINPNPVNQNSSLIISVQVNEITVELKPETRYSGEFYAGEV